MHLNSTLCESKEVSSLKLNLDLRRVFVLNGLDFILSTSTFVQILYSSLPRASINVSCSPWFSGLPCEGITHATMFLLNHVEFYILALFRDVRCIALCEKSKK
jgi:hypothetical protein